jgi:hypothetical protein
LFRIQQSLSGDMSAALRGHLVFEEYGLGAEPLVEIYGVDNGFHVSIPVVTGRSQDAIMSRMPEPISPQRQQADIG